jgi:hypothetical protein
MESLQGRVEGWKHERPSRIWVVTEGPTRWTNVDIFQGHGMAEIVSAIRPSLETMKMGVTVWPLVNERNVRRVLGGEDGEAPYLHGDTGRLILAPGSSTPGFTSAFSMPEVRTMLRVPGKVVIAMGCASGTREWADVYLDAGATDYIAPAEAPFAHSASLLVILLFYALTQGRELSEAVEAARNVDSELAMWRHFRADATT